MRERFCRPISSTSSKPSVIRRPMRAPFSSRIALVAMVVPCTKRSMSSVASPLSASTASTPARTPAPRSSGDEGTFAAQTRSPRRPITSVKVPPMSTPIRNPSCGSVTSISESRLLRNPRARSAQHGWCRQHDAGESRDHVSAAQPTPTLSIRKPSNMHFAADSARPLAARRAQGCSGNPEGSTTSRPVIPTCGAAASRCLSLL